MSHFKPIQPHMGVIGVFAVSIALLAMTIFHVTCLLPESRFLNTKPTSMVDDDDDMTQSQISVSDGLQRVVVDSYHLIMKRSVLPTAFMFFSTSVAFGGLQFMFLFTSFKFGWDAYDVGIYMLVMAVVRVFYMAIVLPKIIGYSQKRYAIVNLEPETEALTKRKAKVAFELNFVRLGLAFYMVGMVFNAFAQNVNQFYAGKPFIY